MTNTALLRKPHTIRVGKEGLTDSAIEEMRTQLKRHITIRVQLPRELAQGKAKHDLKVMLAERLNATVKQAVGFVVVLEKR